MKTLETKGASPEQQSELARHRAARWTLIVVGVLVTLLLAAAAGGWALLVRSGNSRTATAECNLVNELTLMHFINEQERIRVPSDDFTTLVQFAGSLRYPADEIGSDTGNKSHNASAHHLALRLKTVELKQLGANGWMKLVLGTSCARVAMDLASDGRQLIVTSIELETVQVGNHWRACEVRSTNIKLDDVVRRRYYSSCPRKDQVTQYDCKWFAWRDSTTFVQRSVAQLSIHSFEFELGGRADLIRQNMFSKPRSGQQHSACIPE